MVAQKRYIFFVIVLMLAGAGIYAAKGRARSKCTTKESCLKRNCQCYCSGIAGYRNKVDADKPVYVEGNEYVKDNEVVHCFCKQWDIDKFPGPAERD